MLLLLKQSFHALQDNCSPNILEGLWLRGWGLEIVGCGILNTKERNLSHKDQT